MFYDEKSTRAVLSSSRFEPKGCFVAEENRSLVGSIAVTSLPRANSFVIRYLAVTDNRKKIEIVEALLATAIEYAKSKGAKFLRATTPAIEPYVGVYKKHGFVPVRRDFRISWELGESSLVANAELKVEEVSEGRCREAAQLFVSSLSPLWDWRTEEQGGSAAVADSFCEGLKHGERWFLCSAHDVIVGLTGIIVNYYKPGEARFRGAYVVPEHRGKGIGLAVMNEAMSLARTLGQNRMVVYTFSYLDSLAPGALLYIRSGGRIETEYTQLAMQ